MSMTFLDDEEEGEIVIRSTPAVSAAGTSAGLLDGSDSSSSDDSSDDSDSSDSSDSSDDEDDSDSDSDDEDATEPSTLASLPRKDVRDAETLSPFVALLSSLVDRNASLADLRIPPFSAYAAELDALSFIPDSLSYSISEPPSLLPLLSLLRSAGSPLYRPVALLYIVHARHHHAPVPLAFWSTFLGDERQALSSQCRRALAHAQHTYLASLASASPASTFTVPAPVAYLTLLHAYAAAAACSAGVWALLLDWLRAQLRRCADPALRRYAREACYRVRYNILDHSLLFFFLILFLISPSLTLFPSLRRVW
jgi:hypothetical protein